MLGGDQLLNILADAGMILVWNSSLKIANGIESVFKLSYQPHPGMRIEV